MGQTYSPRFEEKNKSIKMAKTGVKVINYGRPFVFLSGSL